MITRDQLEQRKAELERAIQQMQMNLAANQGALQMVEALLVEDKEDLDEGHNTPD